MLSSLGAVGPSLGADRFRLDRSDMLAEVETERPLRHPRDFLEMAASYSTTPVLQFEGCNFLRQRLVLATLSGRTVRMRHIREDSDEPGLKGECFN